MQVVDNKLLVLRTKNPEKYTAAIKRSTQTAEHEVVVFWGLEEARLLKRLGVKNVPSPINRDYNWPGKYKPFKHQNTTASFLTLHKRAFVFNEPGTGKTVSALWAADYLMARGAVRRCLILCPLSIMKAAWMDDLMKTVLHRSAVIAYHTDSKRRIDAIRRNYEFVIMNYDGLNICAEEIVKDGRFDLVIVDEANAYKNSRTQRWKTLNKILRPDTHLWMMTGTPASQSPEDAYGLAKLVNPTSVPKFLTAWRDLVLYKVSNFKWVPKPGAAEQVHNVLQPAVRFTKAECLDLPPVITVTREAPLTTQQEKYYKLLKQRMLVEAAGEVITTVNAAVNVNKLLQISAGAAYTDSGTVVEFDCSTRLNVLDEVLAETQRKVIVFAPYRHSMHTIQQHLQKSNISCDAIHGDVTPGKRALIFNQFQTDATLRVLVIQPQAASHGVTLTAADTVVFWGPVMSVETYIQCIARADRVGQDSTKVTVVHIEGSDVERKMYKVLSERIDDHEAVVSLYKELINM
jgi:SNF2 family DNA or RNA helicase